MTGEKLNVTIVEYTPEHSTSSGYAVNNAFDGRTSTFYSPKGTTGSYIVVDIGEGKQLTGFRYYSDEGLYYPSSITLSCSTDRVTWVTIGSFSMSMTYKWYESEISNAPIARYVKFTYTEGSRGPMRVCEHELYGIDATPPEPIPDRGKAIDYSWTEANEFTWDNFGSIPWGGSGLRSGFLLRSGTTIYTTQNGSVEALTETELTGELFKTYGTQTVPTSEQILTLTDPVLLLWDSDTEIVHTITINMTAVPKPQTICTDDFDMTDSSILGIEKVTATATDATVFAVSFDSGTTWKLWNGSEWATLSESDTGMSVTTLNAITTEQWNSIATTGRIQFRAVLTDNTATITSLVVDFLN